jgi:hypothetical protein
VGEAHQHRGARLRPRGRGEAKWHGAGGGVLAVRLTHPDDRRLEELRLRLGLRVRLRG